MAREHSHPISRLLRSFLTLSPGDEWNLNIVQPWKRFFFWFITCCMYTGGETCNVINRLFEENSQGNYDVGKCNVTSAPLHANLNARNFPLFSGETLNYRRDSVLFFYVWKVDHYTRVFSLVVGKYLVISSLDSSPSGTFVRRPKLVRDIVNSGPGALFSTWFKKKTFSLSVPQFCRKIWVFAKKRRKIRNPINTCKMIVDENGKTAFHMHP